MGVSAGVEMGFGCILGVVAWALST